MKKVRIELGWSCVAGTGVYSVTKLVNMATFTTRSGGLKMIGSTLDPREAEEIARDRRFEVTITQAK